MPISTDSEPNIANHYERAYQMLLSQAPESLRLKVLASVNSPTKMDPDVLAFINRVIALAEQDDK